MKVVLPNACTGCAAPDGIASDDPAESLYVDPVFFDQVVNGRAAGFEQFGGQGDIVAGDGQCLENTVLLGPVAGFLKGVKGFAGRARYACFQAQVIGGDRLAGKRGHGSPDPVLKLPDVSGPGVGHKGCDGIR